MRKKLSAALAAVVCLVGGMILFFTISPARAGITWDQQMLTSCPDTYDPATAFGRADACTWLTPAQIADDDAKYNITIPADASKVYDRFYAGTPRQVSSDYYNCNAAANPYAMSWTSEVGTSDTVGVAYRLEVETGLGDIYKVKDSIEISYKHEWSSKRSVSETPTNLVPGYSKGWIVRSDVMEETGGWIRVNFSKKVQGHYVWYVHNVLTSPGTDPTTGSTGVVSVHSVPLTLDEWRSPGSSGCNTTVVPARRLHNAYFAQSNGENADCAAADGINAAVSVAPCSGQQDQNFVLTDRGDGLYQVLNLATGGCLDSAGGWAGNPHVGSSLSTYACDDSADATTQGFTKVPVASGFWLVQVQTGFCADALTSATLALEPCTSAAVNEVWTQR